MIVFSDLHLRPESEEVCLNEVLPGILKAAEKRGDQRIACLGDFFHLRYRLEVRLFNAVRDELKRWSEAGIRTTILPGNHDQIDISGRNALESYGDIDGVDVYTEPTLDVDGLWIPYRKKNEDILEALKLADAGTVFMHHGVAGAWMNDHVANSEGVVPAKFSEFDAVLTGHYHKRQTIGNIHYIGSPWQTKSDESGQPKGYAVWDGSTLKYVDTSWGKRYHRIDLQPGQQLDLSGVNAGDEVRVTTALGVDPEAVGSYLQKSGISNHIVTPEVEPMQMRLQVKENAPLSEYVGAYVGSQETDLDKPHLLRVFSEISS